MMTHFCPDCQLCPALDIAHPTSDTVCMYSINAKLGKVPAADIRPECKP